jgi:excisionase family DNA binding protein
MPLSPELSPISVTIGDAIRLSGIGRTRIYQAISNQELPSLKLGKRRLVALKDLEDWLLSHRSGARAA